MSSPAFEAAAQSIRAGSIGTLEDQLRDAPDLATATNAQGHTLLRVAVDAATTEGSIPLRTGEPTHERAIAVLLEHGASYQPDADSFTPLHVAARSGHADVLRMLVAGGAPTEACLWGLEGGTALALGLFYAQRGTAEVLGKEPVPENLRIDAALGAPLDRWFDGDELRPEAQVGRSFYRPGPFFPEWTPSVDRQETLDEALTWAARNGQLAAVEALVERGAAVDANPYRGTALLWATYSDQREVIGWLLEHGADPNQQHGFGGAQHGENATAMHLAAQFGLVDALEMMLDAGGDPSLRDRLYDGTVGGWAAHAEQHEVVRMLAGRSDTSS